MSMQIHKDMTIGEVLKQIPEAGNIMTGHGLHCVGCSVNVYETIELGAKSHGLSDEQIQTIVSDLNTAAANAKEVAIVASTDVEITESAAKKAAELMKAEGKEGHGLRVEVIPGGCAGNQYFLDFDNEPLEDDHILEQHGLKLIVSKPSMELLGGSRIDFVDALQGGGFKVDNPNFKRSCGCGKSVG